MTYADQHEFTTTDHFNNENRNQRYEEVLGAVAGGDQLGVVVFR